MEGSVFTEDLRWPLVLTPLLCVFSAFIIRPRLTSITCPALLCAPLYHPLSAMMRYCVCVFVLCVCVCAMKYDHPLSTQEVIVLAESAKNETLICPLCRGVFRDPYIATCGVSYPPSLLSIFPHSGNETVIPLTRSTRSVGHVCSREEQSYVPWTTLHCRWLSGTWQ